MKTINTIFTLFFASIGSVCLKAGIDGHKHQFAMAVICGIMAIALIIDTISINKVQKK